MYEIRLEKFQGPLDLLLQLIEKEEMDITQVSLAQVTDQYLRYLTQVEELNPEEVADFLVVASKLLLIKSRLLLPTLDLGGEEEAQELEQQLKLYREYLAAGRQLDKLWRDGQIAWFRSKPLQLPSEAKFTPPLGVDTSKLESAFRRLIASLEPLIRLPEVTLQRAISIQEKIEALSNLIMKCVSVSWQTFVGKTGDKLEVIVSFLALLELVKQRRLNVEQSGLFHDITISRLS
ncbi:MAG: segregation/condensation protein A [Candidatus Kerfeldbacteria bacterium]|nr:segregation/condensation protein A [Candidatus Kerfeldbacteria bacterium]